MPVDQWYPQRKAWRENRLKIIQILSRKSLTFKDLIEESGLSRGRVNKHLKALEKDHIIKKEYKDGNILNVLIQGSEFDLVGFFLDVLENFGVPRETVDKGREIITPVILLTSQNIYRSIVAHLIALNDGLKIETVKDEMSIANKLSNYSLLCDLVPGHVPRIKYEVSQEMVRVSEEDMTVELNPYVFHIALIQYCIEKSKGRDRSWSASRSDTIADLARTFDKSKNWWFKEVCPYLPLSGFLNLVLESLNKTLPKYVAESWFSTPRKKA